MPEAMTVHTTRRTTQVMVQAMSLPETFMVNKDSLGFFDRDDRRVTLVSKTKLRNEPLFRVLRGELVLKNLSLEHLSMGIGIGGGNTAILVQPDGGESALRPSLLAKAAAVLESVEVVSHSGRGISVLDAASAHIKDSYIHDCAATGVFVGGHGSRAVLETVDVTENGTGNQRGIARGHCGICIEQGVVRITDCNVSQNSAAGIKVILPDLTELTLKKTDILANGISPIQLPVGNMARLVIGSDCQFAFAGSWSNPRSSILVTERADDESESEAESTEF